VVYKKESSEIWKFLYIYTQTYIHTIKGKGSCRDKCKGNTKGCKRDKY